MFALTLFSRGIALLRILIVPQRFYLPQHVRATIAAKGARSDVSDSQPLVARITSPRVVIPPRTLFQPSLRRRMRPPSTALFLTFPLEER